MTTYLFDSMSYFEGFGTAGNLYLDIEGSTVRGSIHASGLTANPTTGKLEGTAAMRIVTTGDTRIVNTASAAIVCQSVTADQPCYRSMSKYPISLDVTGTAEDGTPFALSATSVSFLIVPGGCPQVWIKMQLNVGA
jgi:hypothetical protein